MERADVEYPEYLSLDDLAGLWGVERVKLRRIIRRVHPKGFPFPDPDRRGDHNRPLWRRARLEELNTWWKLFKQRATVRAEGGSDIRSLRQAAGLTQLQAAEQVGGLSRSGWAMLEAGRVVTLDGSRAERIAEVLGTDAQTVTEAHARTRARRKALNKEKNL